jgi:hypothetical protein
MFSKKSVGVNRPRGAAGAAGDRVYFFQREGLFFFEKKNQKTFIGEGGAARLTVDAGRFASSWS